MSSRKKTRRGQQSSPKTYTESPSDYRWIDRDPELENVMVMIREDGRSLTAIARAAWLSPTTLHNWEKNKVKKPNNVSIDFVGRACGFRREWVPIGALITIKEAPSNVQQLHPPVAYRWRPVKDLSKNRSRKPKR